MLTECNAPSIHHELSPPDPAVQSLGTHKGSWELQENMACMRGSENNAKQETINLQ